MRKTKKDDAKKTISASLGSHPITAETLTDTLGSVSPRGVIRWVMIRLAVSVLSFVISSAEMPLETYPLGIAVLAAETKNYPSVFIGVLLSLFRISARITEETNFSGGVMLLSYLFVAAVRILSRIFVDTPDGFSLRSLFKEGRRDKLRSLASDLFRENICLRMASASVAAFLVGVYSMRSGGYRYYDLFAAMFSMLAAPAFTFIFAGIRSETTTRIGRLLRSLAKLGVAASVALSLADTALLSVNIGMAFSFFVLLCSGRKQDIRFSLPLAVCLGAAVNVAYIPAFLSVAVAAYLLRERGEYVTCAASFTLTLLCVTYFDGVGSAVTALPPFLVASVTFVFASSFREITEKRAACSADVETVLLPLEARFEQLGESFSELAGSLYKLSERMKDPGIAHTSDICRTAVNYACKKCPRCDGCHSREELVTLLAARLAEHGRIEPEELGTVDCLRLDEAVYEANTALAELACVGLIGEKTELFALDYDAVSHVLSETIAELRLDNKTDIELSGKLSRRMRETVGIESVIVVGMGKLSKKRIITGDIGKKAAKMSERELRGLLEEACGFPLNNLIFDVKSNGVSLRTSAAKRFSASVGFCSIAADGEECGDTVRAFEVDGDRFYTLISDGMGTGHTAANASGLCGEFTERMLSGGNKKSTSIKMLNTLLRATGSETSATIDLCELDLVTGRLELSKSGAVATLVRRGDRIFKLTSDTAPIGIMRNIDVEVTSFDVEAGDEIVMMSDGVGQRPEENAALMKMLAEQTEISEPSELARRIANDARDRGSRDDITVAVLRVEGVRKCEERKDHLPKTA